jgi:hypothetical protein
MEGNPFPFVPVFPKVRHQHETFSKVIGFLMENDLAGWNEAG